MSRAIKHSKLLKRFKEIGDEDKLQQDFILNL
jgi:hypothetical protein